MSRHPIPQLAKSELDRLRTFRILPNLTKIPLFTALFVAFSRQRRNRFVTRSPGSRPPSPASTTSACPPGPNSPPPRLN